MSKPVLISDAISLIELYQTQYNQTDKLWNYFSIVTLAVLGFTIGSEEATMSLSKTLVIVIGYLVFCSGNYSALKKAQTQLDEFALRAMDASESANIPFETLTPFKTQMLVVFYWSVVVAVVIGISIIASL